MNTPDLKNFPNAPQDWNIQEALSVAEGFGLELTSDHWEAIAGLQEYFSKHELGNRRELVDALDEKFHTKGGTRYLYLLFPGGPVSQGCLIAGLHVPSGSIDKSFGSAV